MGNDGGSIPKRRELVKNAASAPTLSELKATALESLAHAWAHCALTGNTLDLDSVVSDWRGRLYSYEAVLKALMPDSSSSPTPDSDDELARAGIRSLRDVAKLKFTKNGDKYICPISMKEMGPATKAVYVVPCGHVFAEVAMREIQAESCPECGESLQKRDILPLLPTGEKEVEKLQTRMEELRGEGLTHTLKKDKTKKKKDKKRKGQDDAAEEPEAKKKKEDTQTAPTSNGINNPLAAKLAAKVLEEQGELNRRRKVVAESLQSR